MEHIGGYAHKVHTTLDFESAIDRAIDLLAEKGFGVLTEIDVTATMKKKLDIDYKPYRILGACNPPFAHKALEEESLVGVMLPCNVIIIDEGDHRVVAAMNPTLMSRVIDSEVLDELGEEVDGLLREVLASFE